MIRFFILMLVLGTLVSCRSTKKISTAIAKKDSAGTMVINNAKADSSLFIRNTLNQLRANRIEYNTFSAKVNIDYRDAADKNYNVNAIIRMYRDSAIWISANAVLGIEALRVLITKDSVKVLNKLEKTYSARSVDYLQEVTALPLSLATVQDLIMGNPVYLDSNVVAYSMGDGTISLTSVGKLFTHLITLSGYDKTLQRSKLDDADIIRNRTAELTYTDYENKKGALFSTKRRIYVVEKKKLDIRLDFKSYDFNNAVEFPFSVPRNFKSPQN